MGMKVVGKHLEENGFEFLAIKSELGNSPQFVCIKDEKVVFFVLVRTVTFPWTPCISITPFTLANLKFI